MDESRRCRGTSRQSGERCKRAAIPGGMVCVMHGGASPAVRKAAERRQAEAQAAALVNGLWREDALPVTDPIGALAQLAGQMQGAVDVLGPMLRADDLDGPTAKAFAGLLRELRQSLEGMARLNIAEKHIELEGQRAELIVTAFQGAIELLSLPPNDRTRVIGAFLTGIGRPPATPVMPRGPATVELAHDVGVSLAQTVRQILDRLDLSDEQWQLARTVAPEELRRLGERPTVRGEIG